MRGLAKKIAASVMALTLVVAMSTSCFAATWGSYFGFTDTNGEWYEASEGRLVSQSATGWKAQLDSLGWGGIWGCQIFQDVSKNFGKVDIKKGQQYTLSFEMKSSNCDKWVYIKVATGETLAFADWVKLERGKTYKYNKTFKAWANATAIYFGLGGEMGDRQDVDEDGAIRYTFSSVLPQDEDPTYSTEITMSKFSLGAAKPAQVKKLKVKAVKGGKAKVTYKKVTGAAGYQIQYSLKKNMKSSKKKTTKKTSYTLKKLKVGKKYYVRVRAYNKGKKAYGDWSAKKTVKVK